MGIAVPSLAFHREPPWRRFFAAAIAFVAAPLAFAATPLSNIADVSVGPTSACALTSSGSVKCWGGGAHGALGDGSTTDRSVAGPVAGLTSGVSAVAVGEWFGCALTSGGGVKCWGRNDSGQLGDGTTIDRTTPVDVVGLASGVAAIAVGRSYACALTSSGGMKCWGNNSPGSLGDGSLTNRSAPVDVSGLSSGVVGIAAGSAGTTCAIVSGGALKCWGSNADGQLGMGSTSSPQTVPADVPGLASGVVAVDTGSKVCALLSGGGVKCAGYIPGDGFYETNFFDLVAGMDSGEVSIAVGGTDSCALDAPGTPKCWGGNAFSEVSGDGSTSLRLTPIDVAGLGGSVAAISTGLASTCAVMPNAQVMCWGNNAYGQVGNDTLGGSWLTPVTVLEQALQAINFPTIPNHDIVDGSFTVSATASSGLAVVFNSYQPSVCTVSGSTVFLLDIGICDIGANQAGDSTFAAAPQVVRSFLVTDASAPSPPRLANISTRADVGTGAAVLIGGFIIHGSQPKTVLVRARGPALAALGVSNVLANPKLDLYAQQPSVQLIGSNDDWQTDPYASVIQSIGMQPSDPNEAAILVTLQPGAYTAIVSGVGATTGVGLVEVFEINRPGSPLANIATRGQALTGNESMIAGFIIQGSGPQTVVVRARGPSLAPAGIANYIPNPALTLVRSSDNTIIDSNDDWRNATNAADITASGFAPSDDLESAILITLPPGSYTGVVSPSGATQGGIGIVEVFNTP